MIIVSVALVALWLLYIINYETAKWVSIGMVAVIATGLFIPAEAPETKRLKRKLGYRTLPSYHLSFKMRRPA